MNRTYTVEQLERSLERYPHGDGLDHDRLLETALALELAKAEVKTLKAALKAAKNRKAPTA